MKQGRGDGGGRQGEGGGKEDIATVIVVNSVHFM